MFCDHYTFLSPTLTSAQIQTCSSYYRNAAQQPWFMSLITVVPIVIGAIMMVRNFTRSIYDMLSAPFFFGVVAIFIIEVKKNVEGLVSTPATNTESSEVFLRNIANAHAIMAGLLAVLVILQLLAKNKRSDDKKKRA